MSLYKHAQQSLELKPFIKFMIGEPLYLMWHPHGLPYCTRFGIFSGAGSCLAVPATHLHRLMLYLAERSEIDSVTMPSFY
ncbi:hypothetical protein RHMOL_Rhmol08G0300600 [Rhododendron molle]|uniref:Uncharacterized protein n=1 Tax=Rhododendron molle TaxID=49168 RepID=A0ACC0MU93_RHOML|nr:hypothetical protein RHMOL_Rhmol08G0300600 [Rhododendron molle]